MSTPQIVSAWYGTEEYTVGVDVTEVVKDFFESGKDEFPVTNDQLGIDPIPCQPKKIWITYSLNSGELTKIFTAAEYSTVLVSDLV